CGSSCKKRCGTSRGRSGRRRRGLEVRSLRVELGEKRETRTQATKERRAERRTNMNMQCEQFEQLLEQQSDGALPKPALAHLEACQACRALSADFGAIHDMALELGAEEIAPPERVWISLRNQLEAERL